MLEVARHPGVVQLVGLEDAVLRLRHVKGEPLSARRTPGADEMTRIAVVAATTLADLHDIGVVHGAITAEHILVERSGQAIFCSFGRGATNRPAADADVARDVVALAGALLTVAEPGGTVSQVLSQSARAGSKRPTARKLAARLAAARPPAHHPPTWVAVPVVVAAAMLTAVVAARDAQPPHRPHPGALAPAAPPPAARPPACPAVDLGCQPLPRPAGIIATSTGRFRVGRRDDLLVVGRWRCAAPLPALLRPATGEVWVWDSWARANASRPARLVTRIAGATSVHVEGGPAGCDHLRLVFRDGATVAIYPDQPA